MTNTASPKRIAYYGGTFDPVHCGHLAVAKKLLTLFKLDDFVFLPAFHAPHKADSQPTSAYHRFAMLCLATQSEPKMRTSLKEIETGEKRYTIDTLSELKAAESGNTIYFVMGADSWTDIRTWRRWEDVLLAANHIIVTRPGYDIQTDHVTDAVRERIVDLRSGGPGPVNLSVVENVEGDRIYISDAVQMDHSATGIRDDVREDGVLDRTDGVPPEVAKYIEKYELYK